MKTCMFFILSLISLLLDAQTVEVESFNQKVDSLIEESRRLTGERKFDEALKTNAFAEKIAIDQLGIESVAFGSTCFNQGRILHIKGEYNEAEQWYLKSLAIRRNALGKWHLDCSKSLNNLAALYKILGEYEKAEEFYRETVSIREKELGDADAYYGVSLYNLALLLTEIAKYEEAEPLYQKAKRIFLEAFGKEHPNYARCINGLAISYMETGFFAEAERLFLETLSIQENVLGKDHPEYAISLSNLANLYWELGQYDKAEPIYLESLSTVEKTIGKDQLEYAEKQENLAALYLQKGEFKKAESLYLESIEILEEIVGKESVQIASSLRNLANLYREYGHIDKAELLIKESLAIFKQTFGVEDQEYAECLLNFSAIQMKKGEYEKALPMLLESHDIFKKIFGTKHSLYLLTLENLAEAYVNLSDYQQASTMLIDAAAVQRNLLRDAVLHLSEYEINQYQVNFFSSLENRFSLSQRINKEVPEIAGLCYNETLFYKGFLLQAANQAKRLALSNPASNDQWNLLKSYKRRLASQYSIPVEERYAVSDLEEKANMLEKEIVRAISGYGETVLQVKWQEIQKKLQPNEAAIEFVHFQYSGRELTDSIFYVALVLRSGMVQPEFIPLFEENSLDSLIQTNGERKADYVNYLYSVANRGAKAVGRPQKSLYEMLWEPLEKSLEGVETIYFSPSGLLHRLNIGAVPVGEETTISDLYHLIEMGSTRQLVISQDLEKSILRKKDGTRQAILYGGIVYDLDTTSISPPISQEVVSDQKKINQFNLDPSLRGETWNYLKWTDKEVSALPPILQSAGVQTTLIKGVEATEESFKNLGQEKSSPEILHIATHGYFFPDPKIEVGSKLDEPVFKTSEHPMIRSGLLLAGSNYAWENGKPQSPDMEDGILTAYEISQMDLSNTELVVLSACETGLGDIQGNEGVYGLQRAFKIAGAKYLIMSLWQVPDRQTSLLMTTFYEKWIEEEMTIPDAFRAAQQELRDFGFDPYQWAGFVLVE